MSTYGVVSTISAPILNSAKQQSIIRFETEYTAYVAKVTDINRSRTPNSRITPASIKQCLEPTFLHSLCIIGRINGATSSEEASDENVKAWFDTMLNKTPKDLSERVRSAISSVSFQSSDEDPQGNVTDFILSVVTALDKNNASSVLGEPKACEILLNQLNNKLRPQELKMRVQNERAFWTSSQRASISYFEERASILAVETRNGEVARAMCAKKGAHNTKDGFRSATQQNNQNGSRSKSSNTYGNNEGKKRKATELDKEWKFDCLNPQCKEKHKIRDCPITPVEEQKRLLAEFRSSRHKKKRVKAVLQGMPQKAIRSADQDEGRYKVILNDDLDAIALGDYGADVNLITKVEFDTIISKDRNVVTTTCEEPFVFESAFKNSKTAATKCTCSSTVTIPVTIIVPGCNIPVRIRDVEFFVCEEEMDEIILGRHFLKAIGFDLQEHLLQVGNSINNKSINDLASKGPKFASVKYQGMKYNGDDDDPITLPEHLQAGFGTDTIEEIDEAFANIVQDAVDNGISEKGKKRLRGIMEKNRSAFRIKLGPDDTAKVPPFSIKLKPNARPQKCPQRKYAPHQKAFIGHTIRELEKIGAVYKNPTAKWASPALAVPKPGSDALRFAVDSRGPNSQTEPTQSAMPHLDSSLQECQGSSKYANIDFCHGFWQLLADKLSQEIMTIQTHLGLYSPTRIVQGGTDSGNHFQASTQHIFQERVSKLLQWIDDFLLYANTEEELLDNVETFIDTCVEYGFKLHAKKCRFFLKEAKFCGRIISKDGFRYDPRHFQSILDMKVPQTAAQLQQFICATNWMRNSIPLYSQTIKPLHDLLESVYKDVGGRTKRRITKVSINGSWGKDHDEAFSTIKNQLANTTKLSFPKKDHTMCLFTDASETHWAAVLTQIPNADTKKKIEDQLHEPLCFLSGAFKDSSINWSVPEKEGFAIIEAMTKLDYLVSGSVVWIYTDHANLVYMYDPLGKNPGMPRHTASKLMRWALRMNEFRYIIQHLPGERNVWADMLTRWAVQTNNQIKPSTIVSVKSLMVAPINPSLHREYDWPTLIEIEKSQKKSGTKPSNRFKIKNQVYRDNRGVIWIPNDDDSLKLRIIIAAHTGSCGHRAIIPTQKTIEPHFFWNKMETDIKAFINSCLHCLASAPGRVVPRPLAHALHATNPNELIHFDFCYMMPGESDFKYILIIKDDLSGYCWLIPSSEADSFTVAESLVQWFTSFGVSSKWVSDQGSHFKNQTIEKVKSALKAEHHFTTAYCPWANGTVEVVCRELLRATRAILSEFQYPSKSWPTVLPIVQSALNNSPSRRLNGKCPLTAFTGLPQSTPMLTIKNEASIPAVKTLDLIRADQLLNIDRIQTSLDNMHKSVQESSERARQAAISAHNMKTGVKPVNFDTGDYVLKGLLKKDRGPKPSLQWVGPFQVLECQDNNIFHVQHLLTGKIEHVHGRRLKFFQNSSFNITEEITEHLEYQAGELLAVDQFCDLRNNAGKVEVLVQWKGFDETDQDWVDIDSLRQDVPEMLQEFLDNVNNTGSQRQRRIVKTL